MEATLTRHRFGAMGTDVELLVESERDAERLAVAGPCLVNAGGDIATRDGAWPVAVETPDGPLTLELSGSCALATSGRDSRRWRRAGREMHHIIDPATGAPSRTDLL